MTKTKNPKISIITPSFNQGKFISQTIESVLSQQYSNLEFWVMDGGSKDETLSILKSYGDQLEYESKSDKGQTDAINQGLEKVLSQMEDDDIVTYINSDDYYLSQAFSSVVAQFKNNPKALWLVGDALIVDSDGNQIQTFIRGYKKFLRLFPFSIWITNSYPQPSVFLKAGVVRRLGLFNQNLRYTMDYDYWLRVQMHLGRPLFTDQVLSAFRIHTDSKGGNSFKAQFREEFEVLKMYTKNPIILNLHKFHTWLIIVIYAVIKK